MNIENQKNIKQSRREEKYGKGDTELANELMRKLAVSENNKNSKNISNGFTRAFAFRINPLILLVSLILIGIIFLQFVNRDVGISRVNLSDLVSGLKENDYSQLLVQSDGRVQVIGKFYYIVRSEEQIDLSVDNANIKFSDLSKDQFEVIELEEFLTRINSTSPLDQLRAGLGLTNATSIKEVLLGDGFMLVTTTGKNSKDILVRNSENINFFDILKDRNININNLNFKVFKANIVSVEATNHSIEERIASNQVSNIFKFDDRTIVRIDNQFIDRAFLEWTPIMSTFTELLQAEEIDIAGGNFEIVTSNIPESVGLYEVSMIVGIIALAGLLYVLWRGMQGNGGGMGITQFGQSKAKMFFGSKTDTTFKDVAGIDEAREELNEVVDFLRNPNKYRKLGARIPKGILMVGSPGTGKTLLARAIAGEAGVPFFHTSGSEFEEMLVGAGASRVRDLFLKAKKAAPSLIFIDEIDAVARKRGTKVQSGTTEQTLNQILVEMDGFEKNTNVIVIAATNRPDVLDPAILRPGRFDRQIRIELPDMEGRKAILEVHGKNKPFEADVDLEKVAKRTVGFTGADLENILNEAAIIAAKEGKQKINMDDIDEAISKVVLGPAKKSRKRTENELKLVAYHEAGHAVVSRYIPEATPVDRISIISRGSSGGVTMFLPEKDEYIMSRRKILAEIAVSLGGRAAEEIALDDISTGASNDIEKATSMAKRMVQKFGMSEKLGLVRYGDFEENDYLGYAYGSTKDFSEQTAEQIDNELRKIIQTAYELALKILKDNRDKLDIVAKELLEKEVLSKDEFEKLF